MSAPAKARGARVLIAWELGGNLGHVVPLRVVARALRARGHQVLFAMRDLAYGGLLARDGFAFLPAPPAPSGRKPPTYRCYAEMLAAEAFPSANAAFVGALAWRSILRAARPDALLADHAPLALLAARGAKLRTALFGAPFAIPPAGKPLPRFFRNAAHAREHEASLLERLNRVLAALGAPKLEAASDLYRAHATMVQSFPEADCFAPRPPEHYAGPLLADAGEAAPHWPKAHGAKFLVYLKPGPWFPAVLEALAACRASAIAYLPGVAGRESASQAKAALHLSKTPLKLSTLLPQCDAVICHGGNGVVAAALSAGKPLLLLPNYVEQALGAMRLAKLGVAAVASPKAEREALADLCRALSPGGKLGRAAARLALRPGVHQVSQGAETSVRKLEAMLEHTDATA